MMDRRPRFEYETGSFEATISSPSWIPGDATVGGVRVAAGGVPASYIVRRDALVDVTVRFWESEWEAVLALVTVGQSGAPLVWFPDAEEPENYTVYLDAPAAGTEWRPPRDGEFPRVLELKLTLRAAGDPPPWTPYFT